MNETTTPTSEEWMAALRVIEVARDIRDIQFGLLTPFPKSELIEAVDAFYELREKNDVR